jgi:hypothetical protein
VRGEISDESALAWSVRSSPVEDQFEDEPVQIEDQIEDQIEIQIGSGLRFFFFFRVVVAKFRNFDCIFSFRSCNHTQL